MGGTTYFKGGRVAIENKQILRSLLIAIISSKLNSNTWKSSCSNNTFRLKYPPFWPTWACCLFCSVNIYCRIFRTTILNNMVARTKIFTHTAGSSNSLNLMQKITNISAQNWTEDQEIAMFGTLTNNNNFDKLQFHSCLDVNMASTDLECAMIF